MQDKIAIEEILQKYKGCMEEVKFRTNAIVMILKMETNTGYEYTNVEFVCLQFRKILELIALANLVSNKVEYSLKHANFANHYHAKHILRDIEKLNPNFYPIPTKQLIDPATKKVCETVKIESGIMTKEEFLNVYDETSGLMHAENPFSAPKEIDLLKGKFSGWLTRIINLLNHHQIQLVDEKLMIWVVMNGNGTDVVQTTLFERQD